jgi:transcriptional regulator with XRE-family HTH domain
MCETPPFNLARARVNAGLSRRALADASGVPAPTIERLEKGAGARLPNAKKLADFFQVQVTDLMPVEQADAA